MKKTAITIIVLALIASSCGQATKKQKQAENKPDVYAQLINAIETDDRVSFDELINQIPDIDSLIRINENDYSYSLLGYACKYKRCHLVEKLINRKADIDIGSTDEYLVFDALSVAVQSQDIALVQLLLNNGANPNRCNSEEGFTVLSLSCSLGNYDISKLLIENGAKIDGIGDTGFDYIHYPLLHAVESNNIELVQLLIGNNCTIDVKNKQDETAFTIAERNENQQITDLLLENLLPKIPVSEKWYGIYSFTINEDRDDWQSMQSITLRIDKDTVTFEAAGYQIHQYYMLNVKGDENKLQFTYDKSIDTNVESEVLKTTKNFGTLIFDGKNYLWDCPYIDVSFGNNKKKTHILKKSYCV